LKEFRIYFKLHILCRSTLVTRQLPNHLLSYSASRLDERVKERDAAEAGGRKQPSEGKVGALDGHGEF